MPDDPQLLRRYAEDKSEVAFAELVARHIDLVYSAALRQVGGDVHRAQDVAQLVFTTVARKASSLAGHPALPGWLYNTTQHIARRAMRAEYRRRAREAEAWHMTAIERDHGEAAQWEHIRPVLDDAMCELPDRDREAVVLRFFARRPFAEIGRTLGLSEDAARMRVERALDKLQTLLTKRGVTSTSSALGVALANQAVATAPAGLAASITGAALGGSATAAAGSWAGAIAFMTTTKITAGLGVAAGLAIAVAWVETNATRRTAASLESGRKAHEAGRARIALLEKQAQAAEQLLADRENEVAGRVAGAKAAAPWPPSPLAAEPEAAKAKRALQIFLDGDPRLQRLRMERDREGFRARTGPFLRSLRFTPEQIDQAAALHVESMEHYYAKRAAGLDTAAKDENYYAKFRARFGDAAAEQLLQYDKADWGRDNVGQMSVDFFYADDPLTPQKAQQLAQIISNARTNRRGREGQPLFDWDRILAQAEPVLSPTQLQGLRGQAARGRMEAQLAAAAAQK